MDGKTNMSWWEKNSKWVAPLIAVITFIGGAVGGYYKAINDYELELHKMGLTIESYEIRLTDVEIGRRSLQVVIDQLQNKGE